MELPLEMPHIHFGAIDLRDYQDESVEAMRENIRKAIRNQVLCSPTGSGKTVIAAYLLHEAFTKQKRAIFVCDRVALIDQTSDVLTRYGIPHGVIQADHWRRRPDELIQVASAQTLQRRGWPACDLVIVDECHTIHKSTTDHITKRLVPTIGLSATPFSDGLGKFYDAVVNVTSTNKLTEAGHLVPFTVLAAVEPDMKGAKVVAGEWTDDECSKRAMPIVGNAVKEYLQHANGKKFIAFGCDVAHCEELRKQFMAAGITTELYTYKTGDAERTALLKEYRKPDSAVRGLVSVSALSKGFDAPDVECIIMCRPLRKSLSEHIQILGRGLRPHPGKDKCIVLDHAGNSLRFWGPMWEFFENGIHELDNGEKKEKPKPDKDKEKKAVKCPNCFCVHDSRPSCPQCGYEYPKKNTTQHVSGELAEIGKPVKGSREEKQQFLSELVGLMLEHNERGGTQWSDGWVAHKFKAKYGVWPSGLDKDTYAEPSHATRQWVRSQMIRWIKSKERRTA